MRRRRRRPTADDRSNGGAQILVDFDDKGYLLQLFTQPVEDRPTLVRVSADGAASVQVQQHMGGLQTFTQDFNRIKVRVRAPRRPTADRVDRARQTVATE